MKYLKKWMFISNPKKSDGNLDPEEAELTGNSTSKDRFIVIFLFLLMGVCLISFVTGIILVVFEHKNYNIVLGLFSTSLSYLIGYFFGTNKERIK